jgi:hypothetical protein
MINLDHVRNVSNFPYSSILVNFVNAKADELPLPGGKRKEKKIWENTNLGFFLYIWMGRNKNMQTLKRCKTVNIRKVIIHVATYLHRYRTLE